jgi:hypothetical protein
LPRLYSEPQRKPMPAMIRFCRLLIRRETEPKLKPGCAAGRPTAPVAPADRIPKP